MGSIDWTNVIVALIAGAPAIIAAVFAARVNSQIKTPSGDSIGVQVEKAHHTGIANNSLLGLVVHSDNTAPEPTVNEAGLLVAPPEAKAEGSQGG